MYFLDRLPSTGLGDIVNESVQLDIVTKYYEASLNVKLKHIKDSELGIDEIDSVEGYILIPSNDSVRN